MGKVIPFAKPKEPAMPEMESHDIATTLTFVDAAGQETDRVQLTLDLDSDPGPGENIRRFLNTLRGHISKNSIAIARQSLKEFSREDLEAIAAGSTERDWQAKPGYYRALVDELAAR